MLYIYLFRYYRKLSFWAYKQHVEHHKRKYVGGSVEFMCDRGDCRKTFQHQTALQTHLNLHDNNVTKCYFCPWVCSRPNLLQEHLDHHFLTARYKCSFCSLTFYKKNNLDYHFEIAHEIIRDRYQCDFCNFKTHSRDSLSKHSRRHKKP